MDPIIENSIENSIDHSVKPTNTPKIKNSNVNEEFRFLKYFTYLMTIAVIFGFYTGVDFKYSAIIPEYYSYIGGLIIGFSLSSINKHLKRFSRKGRLVMFYFINGVIPQFTGSLAYFIMTEGEFKMSLQTSTFGAFIIFCFSVMCFCIAIIINSFIKLLII